MKKFVSKFLRRTEAATLAEYGLLLALIAVVSIVVIKLLGSNISTMFSSIATGI